MADDGATGALAGGVSGDDGTGGHEPGAEEVAVLPRRQTHDRVDLGAAEEAACACLVGIVDDIFAIRRVADENASCVRVAAQFVWTQALEGSLFAAAAAPTTLDGTIASTRVSDRRAHAACSGSGHQREQSSTSKATHRQCVRARLDDLEEGVTRKRPMPQPSMEPKNEPYAPVVDFLSQLWTFMQRPSPHNTIDRRLALFHGSRFQVSAVPTVGRAGEWEIPALALGAFLSEIVHTAHLSVLPSAVQYVVDTNAALLTKKHDARAHLQRHHIELCVQTALMAAEESCRRAAEQATASQTTTPGISNQVEETVFQTELHESESFQRNRENIESDLLVCYEVEHDPIAAVVDCYAPGRVDSKTTTRAQNMIKQNLARRVVTRMHAISTAASTKSESKWGVLRSKTMIQGRRSSAEINAAATFSHPTDCKVTRMYTELLFSPTPPASSSTKKKFLTAPSLIEATTTKVNCIVSSATPDVATLSNIFSLGTPRQLSSDELSRRNDILAILEREEMRQARKMAVTSIMTVMTTPTQHDTEPKPTTISSEDSKEFQIYAAVNSSVTMTGGSCVSKPPTQQPTDGKRPTGRPKPDELKCVGAGSKSKYDAILDAPRFGIIDGNVNEQLCAEQLSMCSPIKRPKPREKKAMPSQEATHDQIRAFENVPTRPSIPHPPVTPQAFAPSHLPQLDTSRLATGVKAVVHGVEKLGPRHNPSRNSRLRLHNYTSGPSDQPNSALTSIAVPSAQSPQLFDGQHGLRDLLPPVSPIKTSPHRKHVAFAYDDSSPPRVSGQSMYLTNSMSSKEHQETEGEYHVSHSRKHRFTAQQPPYGNRASPPRVRNRHFASTPSIVRTKTKAEQKSSSLKKYNCDQDA